MRGRLIVGLLASFLVLQWASVSASSQETAPDDNARVALRYLWVPFKSERKGGRIYYGMSKCDGMRWDTPFPEILVARPLNDIGDVATLRRFFAKDSRVRIVDSNDIIRIKFGEIPAAILQTKIAEIKFSQEDQYNPELAVMKIENAPEVRAQMSKLGIQTLSLPMNMILQQPMPGFIHLPPIMREITMDEALDVVATTFNGVVETAYCQKARLMDSDVTNYDRQ
jgi:hypothetical protein